MYKQTTGVALVIGLFSLLLAQPAAAGGWTVVTLDELPVAIRSGEPVEISFQVQQHGVRPLTLGAGEVILTAQQQGSDQTIQIMAQPTGRPGHYSAEFVLPASGVWKWEIKPGFFPPAPMPDLTVEPAKTQLAPRMPASGEWGWWRQMAFQIMSQLRLPADSSSATTTGADLATDPVSYGKALFVAKGCATCHLHTSALVPLSTGVGPELSNYQVIPEYVTAWLRDPKAIKPQTQMPTLALQEPEIEALVAFLSAGQR
ncbi:MAG: hypothetical protein DCC55_30500 [Chloroflexi bacterium]|nr:MAG: hypothetical protein DCC55_30500 [Chloroflexota bacterium]